MEETYRHVCILQTFMNWDGCIIIGFHANVSMECLNLAWESILGMLMYLICA